MLFELKNHNLAKKISVRWSKENAPLYITPSSKSGFVHVHRRNGASPYEAFYFLISHLDMPDEKREYYMRKFTAFMDIEPVGAFEKFLGEY